MRRGLAIILAATMLCMTAGTACNLIGARDDLAGRTPAETAANVVKRYHETHVYSELDFFVCSDMALDVWNMLKAQGLSARIQIGNVQAEAQSITEANHAWVLAEVAPGQYLALETTGGQVVWQEDQPLYYKDWSFASPKEYKRFIELKQEHNLLVRLVNGWQTEAQATNVRCQSEFAAYQALVNEYNQTYAGQPTSQTDFAFRDKIEAQLAVAKEAEGRSNQLIDLIQKQNAGLDIIIAEMRGLTG